MIEKFIKSLNISDISNLNNEERFLVHKRNLENKKMLQSCYSDFYQKIFQMETEYGEINNQKKKSKN